MTTIEKPTLPRRTPKRPTADGPDASSRAFVVHFSFNNTVDPAWTRSIETEPTSRRERRVARVAAANERSRQAGNA